MADRPIITSLGDELDLSPESFGWFVSSADLLNDRQGLRQRFDRDGYLYIPGYLDAGLVHRARAVLLDQLDQMGLVDRRHRVSEGVASMPWQAQSFHQLIHENRPLQELLYSGRMIELYELLFAGPVRHLDFTWMRVIGPGPGTAPHVDAVYMNRGTHRLLSSWTPLMDITQEIGGLIVMPGSHRIDRLQKYYDGDVDVYCTNKPNREPQDSHGWIGPVGDGKLTRHPAKLQKRLRLPWFTAERYRPGDVVVFSIRTVHGSLDNASNRIRLSTDSRYQHADEPVDERWVGRNPMGHGEAARKGLIC